MILFNDIINVSIYLIDSSVPANNIIGFKLYNNLNI